MIASITEERMRQIGIALDHIYVDIDNAWGNQCWDAANYINSIFGLPRINTGNTAEKSGRWPGWAGNMVDCFPQTAEIAAAFELVAPNHRVLPGDTLVWSDANRVWFPSTHVANAVVEVGDWVLTLSQNSSLGRPDLPGYSTYSSGPIIFQSLPKAGLLGIVRPRTSTGLAYAGATTPIEDDMFTDQDRADLKLALDKANRAAQVANAIEDSGVRAKVGAIFDMVSDLNEAYRYLKGPDDATLYELADGKLRGITKNEWEANGYPEPRLVSQELINALPKES
jgi:hypothetical protein